MSAAVDSRVPTFEYDSNEEYLDHALEAMKRRLGAMTPAQVTAEVSKFFREHKLDPEGYLGMRESE